MPKSDNARSETRQMPALTLRGAFQPATFNAEKRTAEIVWTTGATGLRRGWDGEYYEELEVSDSAVRLGRLNNGAPLLAAHNAYSLNAVIGVVERAWIVNGEGRALVRFSERAEVQPIMQDVQSGILRNISVGYAVYRYEVTKQADSKIDTYRAVDWEPMEVSIVPIGFDDGAKVRSGEGAETHTVTIITRANRARGPMKNDNQNSDDLDPRDESNTNDDENGSPFASREARVAVRVERQRASTILGLVRNANLSDSFAEELIRSGQSLKDCREAIVDLMASEQRRTQPPTRGQHLSGYSTDADYGSPQSIERAMGEALFTRINPSHKPSEQAQQFVGRSLVDLARECLHAANVSTRMMGASKIIERALGGYHGVSDFTNVLGNLLGRELLRAYELAGPGVLLAGRPVSANDFRARFPMRLGDGPRLEKVNEQGEFRSGSIKEAAEPAWKLDTFGKMFGLTRQAIVNDDLGAFNNVPRLLGIAAREHETQMVVDLLISNGGAGPAMGDGATLFHGSHGNLAASGAVLTVASLGAARAAMRLQKSMEGRPINIVPKYLLVPAALETSAEQLLTGIEATKTSDVNPFSGKLELLVDPRLDAASATRWYLAPDPGRYDGLEYAHLAGESGPQVEMQAGWRVDGVEWKVRLDFGCGFVSSNAWYANPGAAPG